MKQLCKECQRKGAESWDVFKIGKYCIIYCIPMRTEIDREDRDGIVKTYEGVEFKHSLSVIIVAEATNQLVNLWWEDE